MVKTGGKKFVAPPVQKKPRSTAGVAEAKAAAKMTRAQWDKHQVGMAEKWPQPEYMSVRIPNRSHTNYRDETYCLITRWHEETRLSYRPHAKAPGSKSHIRYERYAKAKTVGQALKLGSFPQDWCWDYERGFIKVHGPVREEPIDPASVTDQKSLTAVDLAIYQWHIRELAKKFGLDYKELYTEKGSGESAILRAHRLVADREASKRLDAASKENRRVTDKEMEATLKEWAYGRNLARVNVFPEGKDWVWSDNVGLTRDRCGSIHITAITLRYPNFMRLVTQWLEERLPEDVKDFAYTSINLNCNYAARRHRDGNNFGPSMIAAFGEFTGGQLNYWPEDDKSQAFEELDYGLKEQFQIEKGLALFNGNSAHSVEDFEGTRFSVVFFSIGCFPRAKDEDVATLRRLGIPFPGKDFDHRKHLRAPRGYGPGRPVATPLQNLQPSFTFWSREQLEAPERRYAPVLDHEWLESLKSKCKGPLDRTALKVEQAKRWEEKMKMKKVLAKGMKRPAAAKPAAKR